MPEPERPENTPEPRVTIAKIDAVRQFVQMMKDNELTALDFIDGSTQIRLRRRGPEYAPHRSPSPAAPASPAASPPPRAPRPADSAATAARPLRRAW